MKININKEKAMKAIKYIYCVLLLVALYLLALNGRYQFVNRELFDQMEGEYYMSYRQFDNWTGSFK